MAMKDAALRLECRWIACATSSLPVPDSPKMTTGESVGATRRITVPTRHIFSEWPTISSTTVANITSVSPPGRSFGGVPECRRWAYRLYLATSSRFIDEPLDATVSREVPLHYSRNWSRLPPSASPTYIESWRTEIPPSPLRVFCRFCILKTALLGGWLETDSSERSLGDVRSASERSSGGLLNGRVFKS
jgi:hypothetical protein